MDDRGIPLKDYFDKRFDDLKSYMDVKFENIEMATKLAADSLNVRLESMNEFRDQMKNQANSFMTRVECGATKERYASEIQGLRESKASVEGHASQKSVTVAYVIAGIGILISIINGVLYWFSHY